MNSFVTSASETALLDDRNLSLKKVNESIVVLTDENKLDNIHFLDIKPNESFHWV